MQILGNHRGLKFIREIQNKIEEFSERHRGMFLTEVLKNPIEVPKK